MSWNAKRKCEIFWEFSVLLAHRNILSYYKRIIFFCIVLILSLVKFWLQKAIIFAVKSIRLAAFSVWQCCLILVGWVTTQKLSFHPILPKLLCWFLGCVDCCCLETWMLWNAERIKNSLTSPRTEQLQQQRRFIWLLLFGSFGGKIKRN